MEHPKNKIKVNPPNIPEDTFEEMKKFFAKTSLPRILAAKEAEKEAGKKEGKKDE